MLFSTETLGLCTLIMQFLLPDNSKGEPQFPAKCLFSMLSAFVMGAFKLFVGFVFWKFELPVFSPVEMIQVYRIWVLCWICVFKKLPKCNSIVDQINSGSRFQSCLNFKLFSFRSSFDKTFSHPKIIAIQCYPATYRIFKLTEYHTFTTITMYVPCVSQSCSSAIAHGTSFHLPSHPGSV